MNLIIDEGSTLCEIQQKFRRYFPYLKLQFFDLVSRGRQVFIRENLITEPNTTLGEIMRTEVSGNISINGNVRAMSLEQKVREIFGLNIQVFRKSGNAWMQTSPADDCTLSELNRKGEETVQHARVQMPGSYLQ